MPHHHWQNPHYWHHYSKRYNMFCGPSRLVWFAFGSVATWAYIRHHHYHQHQHHRQNQGAGCPPRVGYGYDNSGRVQWEERDPSQSPPNNNASSSPAGRDDHAGQSWPTQTQSDSMTLTDRDRERLRQMGRSAEETISGMSEATIDSVMSTLQRLKDRLVDRRGQQQLQEIGPQQGNLTAAEEPTGPRHRV